MEFTYENITSIDFFKRILPDLSFEDNPINYSHLYPPEGWKRELHFSGVVKLLPCDVWGNYGPPQDLFKRLSDGIDRLLELELPTWLIICSEEAKFLFKTMKNIVCQSMGDDDYQDIFDYAVISVGPLGKGWQPHRDRDSLLNAFDSEGLPNYITCWMPLTDSTVDNSCLYFIPKNLDKTFFIEDSLVTDSLNDLESFQNIKSIPIDSGGMLSFASRTIHWGSRSFCDKSRKALSLAISKQVFESPIIILKDKNNSPSFIESIVLLSANAIRYQLQHPLSLNEKEVMNRVVSENINLLNPSFVSQFFTDINWDKL